MESTRRVRGPVHDLTSDVLTAARTPVLPKESRICTFLSDTRTVSPHAMIASSLSSGVPVFDSDGFSVF